MNAHALPFHAINPSAPPMLRLYDQHVVWRLVQKPGKPKPDKVPFDPKTGRAASSTDPTTWSDYQTACNAFARGQYNGIGFVFTLSDPFAFVDLDNCRDDTTGAWLPHAVDAVRSLPGAWEISQSGEGLHGVLWCDDKAALATKQRKWMGPSGHKLECYVTGRFIAFGKCNWTGEIGPDCTVGLQSIVPDASGSDKAQSLMTWEDRPRDGYSGPVDDDALLDRMLGSKGGPNVLFGLVATPAALWGADEAELGKFFPANDPLQSFDHSSADQALMNLLAFWTGCNPVRMERLFGRSKLGQRAKWRDRSYYRNRTIWTAIKDPNRAYLSADRLVTERREKQIELNRTIGDDAGDPSIPTILMLEEMVRDLVLVAGQAIVHVPSGRVRRRETAHVEYAGSLTTIETGGFNSDGTPKTKRGRTLALWEAAPDRQTVDVLTWNPGASQFCRPPEQSDVGNRAFNTWKPLELPIVPDDWEQRAQPFLQHVAYLVPIEHERDRFLQWLAHIFQKPHELPHTCYLFVAEQTGIGRNTLASIITRTLRGLVASNVDVGRILDGGFNGRLSRKLLATVDETREGMGDRRYQRANAFRSLVTEEVRLINPKYGLQSVEVNCCRWLMFSNHFDAIPFENTDRRVIVIENPTTRAAPEWYECLHDRLKDETFIASVRRYLMMLDISGFRPGEHAPMNGAKEKALGSLASDADRAVSDFAAAWPGRLATTGDVRDFITAQTGNDRAVSGLTHVMQRAGLVSTRRMVKIGGKPERIVIVRDLTPDVVVSAAPTSLIAEIIDARTKFRFQ